MEKHRYLISEASRETGVEAHVLRYWEEELDLEIPRNDLGHRYYTEEHIRLFQEIQELKDKGYQLKTIRDILYGDKAPKTDLYVPTEDEVRKQQEAKMQQFQTIMTHIMAEALSRNNPALCQTVSSQVGDRLVKEINYAFRENEERQEERFKKLDESLRSMQKNGKARAEAAAAKTPIMAIKKKKPFGRT